MAQIKPYGLNEYLPLHSDYLQIFNNYSNLTKLTNQLTWWILHDWSDEESLKILKKCKESTPSTDEGGKVIIIDVAIAKPNERQRNNGDTTML